MALFLIAAFIFDDFDADAMDSMDVQMQICTGRGEADRRTGL